jgi:hypothetical protein
VLKSAGGAEVAVTRPGRLADGFLPGDLRKYAGHVYRGVV